jgi:hypothetical protein
MKDYFKASSPLPINPGHVLGTSTLQFLESFFNLAHCFAKRLRFLFEELDFLLLGRWTPRWHRSAVPPWIPTPPSSRPVWVISPPCRSHSVRHGHPSFLSFANHPSDCEFSEKISFKHFLVIRVSPATNGPSPATNPSSSFPITVETGSKHSSYKKAQGFSGFPCHIVDYLNSHVTQVIHAETVDTTAYDLIHPSGSQLIQPLLKIKASYCPLLLLDHFSVPQFDDPDLRADIEAGGDTISK